MLGSQILEIAIGLIFVYVLFGIVCSALNEVVAWSLDLRAKTLRRGIEKLLADPAVEGLVDSIYNHPLVVGLSQGGRPPSYISSRSFSLALMDVIVDRYRPVDAVSASGTGQAQTAAVHQDELSVKRVRSALLNLCPGSPVRKLLLTLLDETVTDLSQARRNVALWFDEAMQRVSGWYKRRAHLIVLVCAVIVTVGLNIDTIRITTALWASGDLRAALAAQAATFQQSNQTGGAGSLTAVTQNLNRLQQLELPIGWHRNLSRSLQRGLWQARRLILDKLVGLTLTVIAISLGAPFWFDALNRIANLRVTGQPPAS
jgi:hypothetical protein